MARLVVLNYHVSVTKLRVICAGYSKLVRRGNLYIFYTCQLPGIIILPQLLNSLPCYFINSSVCCYGSVILNVTANVVPGQLPGHYCRVNVYAVKRSQVSRPRVARVEWCRPNSSCRPFETAWLGKARTATTTPTPGGPLSKQQYLYPFYLVSAQLALHLACEVLPRDQSLLRFCLHTLSS